MQWSTILNSLLAFLFFHLAGISPVVLTTASDPVDTSSLIGATKTFRYPIYNVTYAPRDLATRGEQGLLCREGVFTIADWGWVRDMINNLQDSFYNTEKSIALPPGPGHCILTMCLETNHIYACNDMSSPSIYFSHLHSPLRGFNSTGSLQNNYDLAILDYYVPYWANVIIDQCRWVDQSSGKSKVQGQLFDTTNWNVLIRGGEKCERIGI